MPSSLQVVYLVELLLHSVADKYQSQWHFISLPVKWCYWWLSFWLISWIHQFLPLLFWLILMESPLCARLCARDGEYSNQQDRYGVCFPEACYSPGLGRKFTQNYVMWMYFVTYKAGVNVEYYYNLTTYQQYCCQSWPLVSGMENIIVLTWHWAWFHDLQKCLLNKLMSGQIN